MRRFACWVTILCLGGPGVSGAGTPGRFVVATFNLENYLLESSGGRPAKSPAAREQVVREIAAIRPDVLAVQEIGPPAALEELQSRLRAAGIGLPHVEFVGGWDTNIFVAVLSRFPFTARRSHTNDSFLLGGRRLRPGRGIAEVEMAVSPRDRFTLLATHLKSKRPSAGVDEADMREAEARVLREHVDALLRREPNAHLLVCGDFNDHKDSRPLRLLLSKGHSALTDARPAERDGSSPASAKSGPSSRRVVWTHYYGMEDSYARFDYILLSPGMAARWRPEGSYVYASPNWGLASDHRPVVCEFSFTE